MVGGQKYRSFHHGVEAGGDPHGGPHHGGWGGHGGTGAHVRAPAVAGSFYPDDPGELAGMVDRQLDLARRSLTASKDTDAGRAAWGDHDGWPKAVIVPHAGYVYSGTTAALAYALLGRGRGTIRRAVIVGPTHRVPVRGVAACTWDAWRTPLGEVTVDHPFAIPGDVFDEDAGTGIPRPEALVVDDDTHRWEHAVEVQVPFLQRVLGDIDIVPLNAGDASPREVGDVLRALWGGEETVIVISSDLSHYYPESVARRLDDSTIRRIDALDGPIAPDRACGAFPINGLLDVLVRGLDGHGGDDGLRLHLLGRSTSGDDGRVALAGQSRPSMADPGERVVGYGAWAVWSSRRTDAGPRSDEDHGSVLLRLARTALAEAVGVTDGVGMPSDAIIAAHPWLERRGASFVTLTEDGDLRGCIGTLEAYRPLGEDVAAHAADAALRDPRFHPVRAGEYPRISIEVSVLGEPEPVVDADGAPVRTRAALEEALTPGRDGLILDDGLHRATFLPQVWDQLPDPHDFVSHLLAKAGLPASLDWTDGSVACRRYGVEAFREGEE